MTRLQGAVVSKDVAIRMNASALDMMKADGGAVPPSAKVSGHLRVMSMGLDPDPLEKGETAPATLVFEYAGRLETMFDVTKIEGRMRVAPETGRQILTTMPVTYSSAVPSRDSRPNLRSLT